jgi:hypothetical protein
MRATQLTSYSTLAAVLVFAAAAPLHAQRELFEWSGRVDQEILLTMRGRQVTATNVGPSEPGQLGINVMAAMPQRDGDVTVQLLDGRGSAEVVRQPTAANGFTTVVRIRDPQGGAGFYRVEADWQPVEAGEVASAGVTNYAQHVALRWSGDVDDDLEIMLSPTRVSYHTLKGHDPRQIESTLNGIPDGAIGVHVAQHDGRDAVVVTQQPSPDNGYTAILRIHNHTSGFDHYSFDVIWE